MGALKIEVDSMQTLLSDALSIANFYVEFVNNTLNSGSKPLSVSFKLGEAIPCGSSTSNRTIRQFLNDKLRNEWGDYKVKTCLYLIRVPVRAEIVSLGKSLEKFRDQNREMEKALRKRTPALENMDPSNCNGLFYLGKSQSGLVDRLLKHLGSPNHVTGAIRFGDWISPEQKAFGIEIDVLPFELDARPEFLYLLEASARRTLKPMFGRQ